MGGRLDAVGVLNRSNQMRTHVHRWLHRNNPGSDHGRWTNHSRSDFGPGYPPLPADPQHVSDELTKRRDRSDRG